MFGEELLSALIGDIYDAALSATQWASALAKIAGFVGGSSSSLYWKDAASKHGSVSFDDGNFDPHYRQLYFEKFIKLDPTTTTLCLAEIGEPVSTSDLIPYDEFLETRFYKEWVRPQGGSTASIPCSTDRRRARRCAQYFAMRVMASSTTKRANACASSHLTFAARCRSAELST